MPNPFYPADMTKNDFAYIDCPDFDKWFEQNEEDLKEFFFVKYGFDCAEDDELWERFVNQKWESGEF